MKNASKLLVALIVVLFSCHTDEPVIITPERNSYFPLETGNRWEYEPIRTEFSLTTSAVFTIVSTEFRENAEYFAMERIFHNSSGTSFRDTVLYHMNSQEFVYEVSKYIRGEVNRFRLGA